MVSRPPRPYTFAQCGAVYRRGHALQIDSLLATPSNNEVWKPVERPTWRELLFGTLNVRDALFTVDIAIGTKTFGNLVAESMYVGPRDNAISLTTADVESNQPGTV
jgi:hypothetical protein